MTSKKPRANTDEPTNRDLAELVLQLRAEVADLRQYREAPHSARIGRGTPRPPPPQPQAPVLVEDKIQHALVGPPKATEEIAKSIGESINTTTAELDKLERAQKVTKISKGGDVYRWALRAGKTDDSAVRRAVIVGLLMTEPLEIWEILRILGAEDRKAVEADMIEIRRKEPVWWMNKSSGGGRGRSNIYWISPDREPPTPQFDGRLARKSR